MLHTHVRRLTARTALLCASSLLILGAALAPSAGLAAEQTPSTGPSSEGEAENLVDAVVITGSVLQNRAEIRARKESTAVVDTLSSDEIGALPDITIAESMRRIVGVTTIYNDDIGQFASIRGLHPDFIPVTVNGLTLATTGDLGEGTRKVNLQVIPGQAVSQIQAFKTMSADMDAGALGGLINLVPVSAFGAGAQKIVVTGGVSYSSYMDVPDINSAGDRKDSPYGGAVNALVAKRFGANEQFGFSATGFWQARPRTQTNYTTTNRLYFNDAGVATTPESADWNGFAAPTQFTAHNYTNLFTKYGGTGRLEYEPSERFYASLFGFAYFSDEQETRNTNRVFSFDQPQNLTATTGSLRAKSSDTQWRYNTFERDQWGVQLQTLSKLSPRGELSTNLGYSKATFFSDRPYVSFLYKPNTRLTYDLNNWRHPVTLDNPEAYLNPANFRLSETYHDSRDTEADVWEGRIDYGFNNKADDRGLGFAAGLDFRTMRTQRDITSTNYVANSIALTGLALEPNFTVPGFFERALWIDQKKFWGEAVNTVPIDAKASAQASGVGDYDYSEDVLALYGALNYRTDHLDVSGGLRMDDIDYSAKMAQVVGGVLQPGFVGKSGGDTQVLPYFNAVYSFTPDFRLKLAASQTLGRPNPETIATVETVDPTEFTITRGNPDIKPRRSTNYDIGFEKFFNGGQGMITATAFYKDIQDDILTVTSLQQIDGADWEVSQPINGESTVYKGLELGLINNSFGAVHPLLDKVGAQLNLMWVKGETGYLYNGQERVRDNLLFQANFSANAAIFYSFAPGSEIRLAYNRQGLYVEEYGASPWQDVVSPPFATYDLTIKWAVRPNWLVSVEGRNIFDEDRVRNTGPNYEYERARLEIGSSWFVRLSYRR